MNKTNWLIILCVLASVISWFFANDQIIDYLAFSGENLLKNNNLVVNNNVKKRMSISK